MKSDTIPASGSEARLTATSRTAGLLLVLVIAAIVRGGVLFALFGQLQADPDAYRQIAENLLKHHSFALDLPAADDTGSEREPSLKQATFKPTAYRPPLYPCLLAVTNLGLEQVSPLRVAVLHWLLGVGAAGLTWLAASRLGLGWGAFLAAALVMCDPILLNQSALVMTETLATFLATLAVWAWLRLVDRPNGWNAALVGASIGLAAICRPTFLPWLALLVLLLLAVRGANESLQNFLTRVRFAVVISAVALLVLSPWIVRNQRTFGKPMVATTHGGYTLLLGNNPAYYDYLQRGDHSIPWPASDPRFQELLPQPGPPVSDEFAYDATTKRLALETIQAQPRMFLRASLDRVFQLWNPLPHRTSLSPSVGRELLRFATCAWYVIVLGAAVLGVVKLRGRLLSLSWLGLLLLCLTFTLMHSVYWSNLRMRAPLMPVVALLAAAGATSLAGGRKLPVEQPSESASRE